MSADAPDPDHVERVAFGFTPTDEDVERMVNAILEGDAPRTWAFAARELLATIGPIIERERRAAVDELVGAVCEAYGNEGVGIWFRSWLRADDDRKRQMAGGVMVEWSGP